MDEIERQARALGIQPEYDGVGGTSHIAPRETLEKLIAALGAGGGPALQPLVAPEGARCHLPDHPPLWGVAIQLYQLRSDDNWGIGDFADLESLAPQLAAAGADFIGLNPLHALFLSDPARCSPFSPSNRLFLNPLYIAVPEVAGFTSGMVDDGLLARLRHADLVDYPNVAAVKLAALRAVWVAAGHPDATEAFRHEMGEDLDRHAIFEAVSARMVADGHGAAWTDWSEDWQDARGPAVMAFAEGHPDLPFHRWLQDLADGQLAQAKEACIAAGMRIGLYVDLAVGEARGGSGSWGRTDVLADLRIGAPADYFNEAGQDWGLVPFSPTVMAQTRAAPFAELMRPAMRHAGAIRIDHAMGLWQLYLIPKGVDASAGTYARYPLGDMLTVLAAASQDHGTLVIGEDLGNVPPGFREVMDSAGILSYRILVFERDAAGFIPAADYPRNALVCMSTHDLPTFRGWWRGDDISLRERFALISGQSADAQRAARIEERRELTGILAAQGLLADADAPDEVFVGVHRFLARTPSRLLAVRLEDLAGEDRPVNVPSTGDDTYPNWRPKLGRTTDEILHSDLFQSAARALREERPRDTPCGTSPRH